MDHGIDYGMGQTNLNRETGIRFGVIPMNDLNEWAWEDFEADYPDPECPECGLDCHASESRDYACPGCGKCFWSHDVLPDEPSGWSLDDGQYKAEVHSDGDCFIIRSPYYTHAQFCSPCAPGACYLRNPTDESGPRAYCFGHDWFEGGQAPYPVYCVTTGLPVEPEVK